VSDKIDTKKMYRMTIVYKTGSSDTRLVKGSKVVSALRKANGKKSVLQATATAID